MALSVAGASAATKTAASLERAAGGAPPKQPGSAFVSVLLSDENSDDPSCGAAIRVRLRGGHQLWAASGFDAAHLRRLVAVLETAS